MLVMLASFYLFTCVLIIHPSMWEMYTTRNVKMPDKDCSVFFFFSFFAGVPGDGIVESLLNFFFWDKQ